MKNCDRILKFTGGTKFTNYTISFALWNPTARKYLPSSFSFLVMWLLRTNNKHLLLTLIKRKLNSTKCFVAKLWRYFTQRTMSLFYFKINIKLLLKLNRFGYNFQATHTICTFLIQPSLAVMEDTSTLQQIDQHHYPTKKRDLDTVPDS